MISLKQKIEKLSLIKIAGIKYFAAIEIFSDQIKFSLLRIKSIHIGPQSENVFRIDTLDFFKIEHTESTRILENSLLKLLEKIKNKDVYFFISTSFCRTKLFSIPKPSEDIKSWVEENKSKVLSDISNPEQFVSSYEVIYEDDDNYYAAITIARKDHIDFYYNLLQAHNCKIISFTNFNMAPVCRFVAGKQNLSLTFLTDKLIFTYYDGIKDILIDELYLQDYSSVSLDLLFNQLRDYLITKRNKNTDRLNILLNCENIHSDLLKERLTALFPEAKINNQLPDNKHEFITQIYSISKLFSDYDNITNLLEPGYITKLRDTIEKRGIMQIILLGGTIIALLLIILNIFNYYIKTDLLSGEENISVKNSRLELINKLDKDKIGLRHKLDLISSLKMNRAQYSYLLYLVSGALNDNSVLTSFNSFDNKRGSITIEIEGLSSNQESVSNILFCLEKNKELKNVFLVYSNKTSATETPNNYFSENFMKFKITFDLNDNNK